MKKFNKRFVLLLLSILLASILTACKDAGGEEPLSDKTELVYASFQPFGVNQEVRTAIEAFNRTHYGNAHIEIRDYWGDSFEEAAQGRERLIAELLTGNVPDILDLGYTNGAVGMLPYRQMVQKGYLEDLWPYIENDPELGRESLLEAPLKAAEVDGGLYIIFDSVLISTLVGAERVVGDRNSWTMADLQTAFASMPENSTVLQYVLPRAQVAEVLLGMSMDSYIDWESGKCSFDCKNFRTNLTFLKELPEEPEWPSSEEVNTELNERMLEGRQMLVQTYIDTVRAIQMYDILFEGRTAFVGFPVEDGGVGSAFFPGLTRLSISAACPNKEAAWEIVRQLLLPKYGDPGTAAKALTDSNAPGLPLNLADYEMIKQAYMTEGLLDMVWWPRPFIDSNSVKLQAATEDEVQRFEDLLNSIERLELCDSDLLRIVLEQAGPYFTGDKTLDETVELIQRRVTLYVNEQK